MQTWPRILACARRAFVRDGYEAASFRQIARDASVTTGAIYGYVKDKDALMSAVVRDEWEELLDAYAELRAGKGPRQIAARDILARVDASAAEIADAYRIIAAQNAGLVRILYSHRDIALLVLTKAHGSSVQGRVNDLIDAEIAATQVFIEQRRGRDLSTAERDGVRRCVRAGFEMIVAILRDYPNAEEAQAALNVANHYMIGGYRGLFVRLATE